MSDDNLSSNFTTRVLPLLIITLASLFYVYEFMLRVMPSAMKHDLMTEFAISASGFGIMGSLFYWGYFPMQIPAGLLFDRFSTRTILTVSVFLCGAGAIIFGVAHQFFIAGIGRYIIGISSAFAFVGALVLTARWFPAKYFALITGIVQFLGSIGAVLGVDTMARILLNHSWRSTQMVSGVIGIVLAVLFWLIIRDRPQKPINQSKHTIINHKLTEKQRLKKVLSNAQTWWVGLYACSIWAPMTIFPAWWGMVYLSKYYGIEIEEAGRAITFIWLGNAFASPLVGWWTNRINNRRLPLITSAIITIITSTCAIYIPNLDWYTMCIILTLFGAASAAHGITFGLVQDNMPPEVAGTAVGFNNMAVVLGGALFVPLVGVILDFVSKSPADSVNKVFSLADYGIAFAIIPVCGVIGLITSIFFIKETHCQAQYELGI